MVKNFLEKVIYLKFLKKKNKAVIIKKEEINNDFFNKIRFHENIILDNLD